MERRRILIVEDESIVRLHLRQIVGGMGHEITGAAASAEEALACAEADPPDLVLMDINLRGERDGVDAARDIVARHGSAVIFATAFADDETIRRTETAGAVGYVLKPFDERAIRAAVTTALREHDRVRVIRDTERSLHGILSSLGEAVVVMDADGGVSFLNSRAEALMGKDAAAMKGRPVWEALEPVTDDAPMFRRVVDEVLGGGAEASQLPATALVCADGREVLVDGTLERLGAEAGAEGCVLTLRDLTSRWFGRPREVEAGDDSDPRLLIYSHDTFGLGHLRRSLNLASALVEAVPGLSVLVVTGSPVAHRFALPPRVDYVKLPAVRKMASDRYSPRSLSVSDDDVLTIRSNLILRTVRDFRPDIVLVDHSPAGMKGELRPALTWLRQHRPECATVAGLRDIIDSPELLRKAWRKSGIDRLLEDSYDHLVIYGPRDFHDPVAAYGFSAALAAKTTHLDFVVEELPADTASPTLAPRPHVLVTAGGGDGAADLLAGTFLEMLERGLGPRGLGGTVLPGPLAPPELREELRRRAEGLPVTVLDFVESTSPYMREADAVVCTGGYNTSMQLLRYARRAVMVPRVMHREEQLLRARRLAELGYAACMTPDALTPESLAAVLAELLSDPREPLTLARESGDVRFDGARRLAEFCASLLRAGRDAREAAYE